MTAQTPPPVRPPNITTPTVQKITPPAPSPNRPAMGPNNPTSPISHDYHGEQHGGGKNNGPSGSPLQSQSEQPQESE